MKRVVEPELLDVLPWNDPQAMRSRADLRRVNMLMNNSKVLAAYLRSYVPLLARPRPHLRLVEIGAGDGTVLLAVAKRLSRFGATAEVVLIDNQPVFTKETRDAFAAIGWQVRQVVADVLEDLRPVFTEADAVIANMFLHQFKDAELRQVFTQLCHKTSLVVAVEPRRSRPIMMAGGLLWLLGCSEVTRHDGAVSIRAGFRDREMSGLWPDPPGWDLVEGPANLFNHGFVARRKA